MRPVTDDSVDQQSGELNDDHPHLAAQAAARKLARSEASTSEHGAEQQVWGWWARAQA